MVKTICNFLKFIFLLEREEKLKNLILSTKEFVKNNGNSKQKKENLKECKEIEEEENFHEEEDKRVFAK